MEDFNEAIHLEPERPGLYAMRADTYRSLGRFASAIGDYTEAIRRSPKVTHFYFERGSLYLFGFALTGCEFGNLRYVGGFRWERTRTWFG